MSVAAVDSVAAESEVWDAELALLFLRKLDWIFSLRPIPKQDMVRLFAFQLQNSASSGKGVLVGYGDSKRMQHLQGVVKLPIRCACADRILAPYVHCRSSRTLRSCTSCSIVLMMPVQRQVSVGLLICTSLLEPGTMHRTARNNRAMLQPGAWRCITA